MKIFFQKADAKALFGGDLSSTDDDESKKSDKEEDRELTADDVVGPRLYSEPEGASIIQAAFHLDYSIFWKIALMHTD